MRIVGSTGRPLERICIYGAPKVGKTTLATSLPWGEYWGEGAIYVAADAGVARDADDAAVEMAAASTIKSVLPHNRERLRVIVPDGRPNWMEEAVAIALGKYEERVLIWDTMTETSRRILREYSDSGVFSDKHAVQVGTKQDGSWHTSPMEGDYGAAQNTIAFLHERLWAQPMHLIIIFHEDWMEPGSGALEGLQGGPATVGKKAIRWIPAKYDTVLWMKRDQEGRILVATQTQGIWPAGVRTGKSALLDAQIPLQRDPSHFWLSLGEMYT